MSNQCSFPSRDPNPCNDMDAWWNMITSVYNFLSASTNLAQTLDRKYASHRTNIFTSPLLIEAPPEDINPVFPEEFPWFVQLMNCESKCIEETTNVTVVSNQQTDSCKNCPELPPVVTMCHDKLNTDLNCHPQIDDKNVIEKELHNVLVWEQTVIQNYLDKEEEALDDLVQNVKYIPTTSGHNSTQQEKDPTDGKIVKFDEVLDDSCDIQKFELSINSLKLQNAHQSVENTEGNEFQKCLVPHKNLTTTMTNLGIQKLTGKQDSLCEEKKTVNEIKTSHDSTVNKRNSKVEQKHCSKCNKPSKCKHDEPTEKSSSPSIATDRRKICGDLNTKTNKSELRSIKTAPPDNRHSKYSPTVPRNVPKKNYSEIVPKNLDELKEHLNSISKSKLYKKPTRSINTRPNENGKLSDDPEKKNVNFTVFTAKISYKDHKKDQLVSKKNYRVSNRFASVESVVKKLITGGAKVNKHADIVLPSSPKNNRNSTLKTTNSSQINCDPSAGTNTNADAIMKDNKTSKKQFGEFSKPASSIYPGRISEKTNNSIVHDKSLRNRYTISNTIKPESSSKAESTSDKKTSISKMNTSDSGTGKRFPAQKFRVPSRERPNTGKTPAEKNITKNPGR